MNAFEKLIQSVRADLEHAAIETAIPLDRRKGVWMLTITLDDGFTIEVEWNRYRGFGLSAGWELAFGVGVDEVHDDAEQVRTRILALAREPRATSADQPLPLGALRRALGWEQNDLATKIGMTKAHLAQLERPHGMSRMQIDTLSRVLTGLGGELEVRVRLPNERVRRLLID